MADEPRPHHSRETTPERVQRVLTPLNVEPPSRGLLLVAVALLGIVLLIIGVGLAVGLGAGGIFNRYTEQIERQAPGGK
jgi:hypothetical protein